eukprot:8188613-Pyramimonas_sp.AAC.1
MAGCARQQTALNGLCAHGGELALACAYGSIWYRRLKPHEHQKKKAESLINEALTGVSGMSHTLSDLLTWKVRPPINLRREAGRASPFHLSKLCRIYEKHV